MLLYIYIYTTLRYADIVTERWTTVVCSAYFGHLQAQKVGGCPWRLSFSFGRALQASVLSIWSKDQTAVVQAKQLAEAVARANGLAVQG